MLGVANHVDTVTISHNATGSFSYRLYALLLLVVQYQILMSMKPKCIATSPGDQKVVAERRDVVSCLICQSDILRDFLLNIGTVHQVQPRHVVVNPGQTSCQILIDDHEVLIVLLVRKPPFLAKSHDLRDSLRGSISVVFASLAGYLPVPSASPEWQDCDKQEFEAA